METASREAGSEVEVAFALALGVRRRRGVPLVGESAGVEGVGRGVCEKVFVARRVEVDVESCWTRWGMERVGTRSGMRGLDYSRRPGASGEGRRQLEGIDFPRFQKPGIRPKGSGQVEVCRGVKGLSEDGVEVERELLDLLGKDLGAYGERTCTIM